jgi:hypothetical protein
LSFTFNEQHVISLVHDQHKIVAQLQTLVKENLSFYSSLGGMGYQLFKTFNNNNWILLMKPTKEITHPTLTVSTWASGTRVGFDPSHFSTIVH